MITLNGYKFLAATLLYGDGKTANVSLKNTSGTNATFIVCNSSNGIWGWCPGGSYSTTAAGNIGSMYYITAGTTGYYGNSQTVNNIGGGVWIGDGNTPATIDDYNLSGSQITTFTASTTISSSDNNEAALTATYNITNTSGSEFTIREYGIFIRNGGADKAMLTHEVLATPITIAASGTGVLVAKFKIV